MCVDKIFNKLFGDPHCGDPKCNDHAKAVRLRWCRERCHGLKVDLQHPVSLEWSCTGVGPFRWMGPRLRDWLHINGSDILFAAVMLALVALGVVVVVFR